MASCTNGRRLSKGKTSGRSVETNSGNALIQITRTRNTDDHVTFDLGNTERAPRPIASVPTAKLTATIQSVEADDEPRAHLIPGI
jgi:hypothetical protein